MYWRLVHKEYEKNKGAGNKKTFYTLAKNKLPLGVLAYDNHVPVGWCSVSPRSSLVRLEHSRLFRRMDNKPVWSITCLFIEREFVWM